ncbi:MAG: hypothetical protein NVS1B10_03260 [Candidatus Saccharimonadales bacterium]
MGSGMGLGAGIGAVAGGLGGAFSKKEAGPTAANQMELGGAADAELRQLGSQGIGSIGGRLDQTSGTDGTKLATDQVQGNSMLGGLFGKGGTMDRTAAQEKDLSQNGFKLNDQDRTAYGQASGDIARQFGQSDQSLAQSLSDRGMSSSGVANSQFSNSLGNKNEQLSGLQMQIANNRMQMNQQRLSQTQNFLGQLGGQAQNAIQSQYGRQLSGSEDWDRSKGQTPNNAAAWLGANDKQANEQISQSNQGAREGSGFSRFMSGAAQGASAGAGLGKALDGMSGDAKK